MEYAAFEKVPQIHRTWTWKDQFAFWFGACSLPAAWYYGALMAGWQGIGGAMLLIIGVNALALIPWAYLGEMAATTGGSSMAIIRPSFGIRGSVIPSIFYLIFGFGWGIVNVFIGAISLSVIFNMWLGWPSYFTSSNTLAMVGYVLLIAILQGYFAVYGSSMIKKLQWIAMWVFLILGVYQTYIVLSHWGISELLSWRPTKELTIGLNPFKQTAFTYAITFGLLFDLLVSYNWTWEFIGDFSRYAQNRKAGAWGPFWGALLAQIWWFTVGALAVVYLAVSTGEFSPLLASPSATSVSLGLGWAAALVVVFATITTNAGNIYATSLGLSNIIDSGKRKAGSVKLTRLLWISAIALFPLSLLPLLSGDFLGFFMLTLDVMGAIVIPLWTIAVVDYFFVHKRRYTDDIFKKDGGAYWYTNGWNKPGITALLFGTVIYLVCAYVFPGIRQTVTATIPTIVIVSGMYLLFVRPKLLT